MKPQKFFVPLAVSLLLSSAALPAAFAQDMAATQAVSMASPTPGETPAPKGTQAKIEALEQQNAGLESRMKALEDEVGAQKAAPGSASAPTPATTSNSQDQVGPMGESAPAGGGSGVHDVSIPWEAGDEVMYSESRYMSFSNKSGDTEFRIGGYEWMDLDINNQSNTVSKGVTTYSYLNNPSNNENGFEERKAHLDFRGTFDKIFGAAIGIESDKSTGVSLGLYHAYFYAKFDKAFTLEGGKITNPLSLEGLQPSANLPFVEASMLANLTINKVIGIMAEGQAGHVMEYQLMLDNGAQDNESSATGPGKPEGDNKDLTARVFFTPWEKSDNEWLSGLGFGGAASADNETGEDTNAWSKMETAIGGNSFMTYNGIQPNGPYYHVDGQGYYYNGQFGFLGEYVNSIQSVSQGAAGVPVQLTNTAWLTEAQWVFGGKAGFEGATVDNPFDPANGKWGALELAVRTDTNFMDVRSFTVGFPYAPHAPLATGAQIATAFGVGFSWLLSENFKLMCDGEQTTFSGGNAKVLPEQIMVVRAALTL